MRSFWFDPYLWVHLSGIAAVPLLLELCLLGLAIGEPLFPIWFELLFVGTIGILPILWMQWQRPFSIFSLVLLALKPSQLTEDQCRILQRFKLPVHRVLAVLSAVAMVWVLWQLYQIAPAVSPVLFPGFSRGAALLIAAIAFLGSNLFLQVPVSVLSVLLTSDSAFATTPAYPKERITQDFTVPGIQVAKILPPLIRPIAVQVPPETPSATQPATKPVASASVPPTPISPTEAITAEPPPVAAGYEPEQEPNREPEQELEQELDDQDDQFDEVEADVETKDKAEVDAIVAEEAEIVETIARNEIAAIDLVETQTLGAVAGSDLENGVVEAVVLSSSPDVDSIPTQLDESGEVVEEIIMPPEQPVTTEPEFTGAELTSPESNDSESVVPRQVENNSEIGSSSTEVTIDAIDSQSRQAVEMVESVEIVEDTTIVETFDVEPSGADQLQTNQTDLVNQNEENSEEKSNETESQQGVEQSDPWQ